MRCLAEIIIAKIKKKGLRAAMQNDSKSHEDLYGMPSMYNDVIESADDNATDVPIRDLGVGNKRGGGAAMASPQGESTQSVS